MFSKSLINNESEKLQSIGLDRSGLFYINLRKSALLSSMMCLLLIANAFGQHSTHSAGSKDRALRGSGRVNPSTLGVEIDIPLGNYPGRGINVPISLSYSSKLWRTEFEDNIPRGNNPGDCIALNQLKFADRSASGWTTSLAVPYIEYTGVDNLYNEKGFAKSLECTQVPTGGGGSGQQQPPTLEDAFVKRLTVHLPSGETHELRANDTITTWHPSSTPLTEKNGTYYATDGSNIVYRESSSSKILLMPDGSKYEFANTESGLDGSPAATIRKATRFIDRNGNFTTYNVTNDNWTDTLGRTLSAPFGLNEPSIPTPVGSPQVYNMPGLNGGNVTYKFHWKKLDGGTQTESALTDISNPNYALKYMADRHTVTHARRAPGTFLFTSQFSAYVVGSAEQLFNPVVLTEIELPTGQSYKFTYDNHGRIERIYYPTGGEERFTYTQIAPLTMTLTGDVAAQTNFGVTSRQLFATANSGIPYVWTYDAEYFAPAGYKVTTTTPEKIKSERFLHRGNDPSPGALYGKFGYDDALAGMVYEQRVYDKSNQIVSRSLTHWEKTEISLGNVNSGVTQKANWHPRVTHTESHTYHPNGNGNAVKAARKFEYENEANLNLIETPVLQKKTLQYAYEAILSSSNAISMGGDPDPEPTPVPTPVPPNLVRTTEVTYLINDNSLPQARRDLYYNISSNLNMVGLTTASVVKDSTDINIVSRSEMKYDDSGYSPNVGRGNPTTSRVWDSTKGPVTDSNAYIETHAKFDSWGNKTESTDALNNTTFTTFDAANHAFPIMVTTPIPDTSGTNGADTAFTTHATFDFENNTNSGTGLPLTTTDANGLETRIAYDPTTLRPTNVKTFYQNNQIGSTTETIYSDQPNNYWVKNRAQIDANYWTESITYFDGLGRAYKSEQIHTDGNIFVEKEFDSEGRVSRVSNPYRTGQTKFWATNVYDDAGRLIEVILQDGAKVKTDYAVSTTGIIGTTKRITDQAGKKRMGIIDVLGRIVRVIEDPDGQVLETNYKFDTLGNLRETIQGDQHRYFMHDSLGRLLYSKQPEQDSNASFTVTDPITNNTNWSNKYDYDDGGNVILTTDATGVSVTANYDKFSRIILRDYDDDTPDVSFFYDGYGLDVSPGSMTGAVKGQITKVTSSVSESRFTNFDDLGRLLNHEQRTRGTTYETEYTYNLSGAILTETYPSGRVMNYEYRPDGELDKLSGSRAGNLAIKTYANNISYNTLGNIEKMRLGNGTWETTEYNDRQQVKQIALGQYESDKSLLKIDYAYGTITENNGSLRQQKINYNGLIHEIIQDYTYDDLNRLKSAKETSNTTQTWKQTFNYDRYGNREFDGNNTTTLPANNKITNPEIETSNNRLKKDQDSDSFIDYDYDRSGNVTLDAEAQRFVYDAENRIKEFFKGSNNSQNPDATYEYDGDGKRVRKISDQTETIFVYDAGGKLVAEYSNQMPQAAKISYMTTDHLGSPRIITDGDKDVVSRHDYLAFGDEVTETVGNVAGRTNSHGYGETDEIRKQYTGYERDKESGLDFAQARYYNSNHGRFTSIDPLVASANVKDPQTFNRYSYVLNSPYKFVDPLGLIAEGSNGGCAGVMRDGSIPCSGNQRLSIMSGEIKEEQKAEPPPTDAEQNNDRPKLKHNFPFQGLTYTYDNGYELEMSPCAGQIFCKNKGLGLVPVKLKKIQTNIRDIVYVNDDVNYVVMKMMSALKENEDIANSLKNAIKQGKGTLTVSGFGAGLNLNFGLVGDHNVSGGLSSNVNVTLNNTEDVETQRLVGEDSIIRDAIRELGETPTLATGSGNVPRILESGEQNGLIRAGMKRAKPASALEQGRINRLRGQ